MDLLPLIRANTALLKFCRDHNAPESGLVEVQSCLGALQQQDIGLAMRHFRAVPLGGMGSFGDWFPPVVFQHEDPDYVWTVFEALTERWYRLMTSAYKEAGKPPPRAEESTIGRFFRSLGLE
jgi:hypothetical protein